MANLRLSYLIIGGFEVAAAGAEEPDTCPLPRFFENYQILKKKGNIRNIPDKIKDI
jgi:hypothetical protein